MLFKVGDRGAENPNLVFSVTKHPVTKLAEDAAHRACRMIVIQVRVLPAILHGPSADAAQATLRFVDSQKRGLSHIEAEEARAVLAVVSARTSGDVLPLRTFDNPKLPFPRIIALSALVQSAPSRIRRLPELGKRLLHSASQALSKSGQHFRVLVRKNFEPRPTGVETLCADIASELSTSTSATAVYVERRQRLHCLAYTARKFRFNKPECCCAQLTILLLGSRVADFLLFHSASRAAIAFAHFFVALMHFTQLSFLIRM